MARSAAEPGSNGCATGRGVRLSGLLLVLLGFTVAPALAQQAASPVERPLKTAQHENRVTSGLKAAGGALAGLAVHEAGHLFMNIVFDADPSLKRVDFHGIPFFALTHRPGLSPRRELAISSAGFWMQHAGSEWIFSRHPRLRGQRAPFVKGILAFNIAASAAYAGAAFARTGPHERDTRGIADAARVDERWVGALVLAPAALDAVRYFDPDARWPVWASRGAKLGMFLLFVR